MAGRRIGGAGGGSEKGSGGGVVIALAIAVAVSAGGAAGGSALSSAGSAGGSSSVSRSGSQAKGRDAVAVQARLTRLGVRISGRLEDESDACVANSYGRVHQYLQAHPCSSLRRAQFEVRDSKGDVALVPVAWVEMPTEAEAVALKQLLDTGGTGNITELSRQRGRYRTVRYTGDAYASRQDGRLVINAQAQPVLRGWTGLALTSIATNAVR